MEAVTDMRQRETSTRYFVDGDHAKAYAKYRLSFPAEVFERIAKFVQDGGHELNTAVDVGCGTGHQSTIPLAGLFKNVTGVDISEEQINHAPRDVPNVTFRVARAEDLEFIGDSSMDLVSVATAIHWLDLTPFYKEVDRILKPGGCLAVYWQGRLEEENDLIRQELNKLREATFHLRAEAVVKLWDRQEIPECPYGSWNYTKDILLERRISVEDYICRQKTMSYNHVYLQQHPGTSLFEDTRDRLIQIVNETSDEVTGTAMLNIKYPIHLLLCHKPTI